MGVHDILYTIQDIMYGVQEIMYGVQEIMYHVHDIMNSEKPYIVYSLWLKSDTIQKVLRNIA